MAISVPGLCETFFAEFAFKRHGILVNTDVISQIAKLWELKRAHFALQDLIHPFCLWVIHMYKIICLFVDHINLLVIWVFFFDTFGLWLQIDALVARCHVFIWNL